VLRHSRKRTRHDAQETVGASSDDGGSAQLHESAIPSALALQEKYMTRDEVRMSRRVRDLLKVILHNIHALEQLSPQHERDKM
jgi:hypothetical protein